MNITVIGYSIGKFKQNLKSHVAFGDLILESCCDIQNTTKVS